MPPPPGRRSSGRSRTGARRRNGGHGRAGGRRAARARPRVARVPRCYRRRQPRRGLRTTRPSRTSPEILRARRPRRGHVRTGLDGANRCGPASPPHRREQPLDRRRRQRFRHAADREQRDERHPERRPDPPPLPPRPNPPLHQPRRRRPEGEPEQGCHGEPRPKIVPDRHALPADVDAARHVRRIDQERRHHGGETQSGDERAAERLGGEAEGRGRRGRGVFLVAGVGKGRLVHRFIIARRGGSGKMGSGASGSRRPCPRSRFNAG